MRRILISFTLGLRRANIAGGSELMSALRLSTLARWELANGLEYVVEAAKILASRNRGDIVIVLHGDGGAKRELQRMVQELELY